ncbi:MAG TPA: hypothetical protein VFR37_21775 [Longimicrobium sp.]|nr:hypothetical protein [Longimicrobium sp.]
MDASRFARSLAQAALAVLAESDDSRGGHGLATDLPAAPRMRAALLLLLQAEPTDLAAHETIAVSLLDARESFDAVAGAHHRELEAADASSRAADPTDQGELTRLLERHIGFAESSVLLGVTQTLLEHCGRLVGWTREWQLEMQPFRSRAESRAGHPGRIGRFVAAAKARDAIPPHLPELAEKEFDMLFGDTLWGIPYSSFRTLGSGGTWADFLDVAHLFDAARLERATQLYLQYVMVARAFHWPPDSFAVRLSYLARLNQLVRPAVPA